MATGLSRKTPRPEPRSATINLRAGRQQRDLIERAAEASGKTMTAFVLDSATAHAVEVLLDQRLFVLDDERHAAFLAALDHPPPPNAKLKALMRRTPRWER